jgi:hypothetical protein
MSAIYSTGTHLSDQLQLPAFLSANAAARRAGLQDYRRVTRQVQPDAWELGPNDRRWPLYLPSTIEAWIASGMPDGRFKRDGGTE